MVYQKPIEGKYVTLRSCTEEDAEFTLGIRQDPDFVDCFPPLDITLDQQKAWINKQREKPGDYFFVVWDKDGNRIGTISIYGVEGKRAESGRLAIKGTNPFQALEAQILSFRFAFGELGLECIDAYIFADNERALRFNKQFAGRRKAPEIDENGNEIIRIENWKEDFEKVDKRLSSILYREKQKKEMNQ